MNERFDSCFCDPLFFAPTHHKLVMLGMTP